MPELYKRTVDDVKSMLHFAKQREDEINSTTQIFYYPSQSDCDETKESWKLMDLDEEFIQKLQDGERLIFKGCDDEKIVLCTEEETFEVKEGEISNSLIVCPYLMYNSDLKCIDSNDRILKEQKICGVFNNYLEIRPTYPRLNKLRKFLECTAYKGPDKDEETHEGYYFSELLENIQCSRAELVKCLQEIKAVCYEDKWRILDLEFETKALSLLISLVENQNWEAIHGKESKRILKNLLPEFVIDHIIKHFATQHEEDKNLYSFKEDKVSQSFSEMLLITAAGRFRHNEFVMALQKCLPPGVKADLKHLRGLALVEKEELQQEVIYLFPEFNLPENIPERFRLLFKRKEKWTLDEITPYIEKLATKSMNVNTMLTKYARASNQKGVRVFGARYAN